VCWLYCLCSIKKWGKVGAKCAIIGIGGLGHLGVQFSSKMGMKTYAISTSDTKKDAIMKLGAHVFVNSKDTEQFNDFLTQQIDVIINTSGSGDIAGYMKSLKKGSGVFVQVGAPEEQVKINIVDILMNQTILAGSGASNRQDMREMLQFAADHKVISMNEMFKFEDFPKAYERIQKGRPEFRVVVDVKNFKDE